jgi:type II secretory pathway predicted ATPase ExeA
MQEGRFGLRRRPFPATPDGASYYPATGHERALARLLRAVRDDEGLALLTGEPGTGKTLLCHCLLERLGPDAATAFLTNSHLPTRADLLQALLYDLGLPHEGRTEQELRLRLTDHLLQNFAAGRRTVFVLDEAQHLGADVLEELRLLGNLEAGGGKAVQVILAAQPGILQTLRRPELAAVSQRLAVRVRVAPLGVEEAADYLLHHLRLAGARPEEVFTGEAVELLARASQGVPRVLNQAAHQALLLAHEAAAEIVDVEVALEALTALGLEVEELPGDVQPFPSTPPVAAEEPGPTVEAGEEVLAEGEGAAVEGPPYRLFDAPRQPA